MFEDFWFTGKIGAFFFMISRCAAILKLEGSLFTLFTGFFLLGVGGGGRLLMISSQHS